MTCPACLGGNAPLVFAGGKHAMAKCRDCGLVFTSPMPTDAELLEYYQGFSFQLESDPRLRRHLPAIRSSLMHFVGEPALGGRFLDYGGGCGVYAAAAAELGWRAELFDYDCQMVAVGKRVFGIDAAWTDLDSAVGPYEIIFAFHVVEHWNHLDRHLGGLLQKLQPGGSLVGATPNALSLEKSVRHAHRQRYEHILEEAGASAEEAQAWLRKADSVTCWDPPRHLFAFTPGSLESLGRRHGLVVEVTTGYNTDLLFEPRGYIVPTPLDALRDLGWRALRRPRHALRRLARAWTERRDLGRLRREQPAMGEQLYFKMTKPDSIQ